MHVLPFRTTESHFMTLTDMCWGQNWVLNCFLPQFTPSINGTLAEYKKNYHLGMVCELS